MAGNAEYGDQEAIKNGVRDLGHLGHLGQGGEFDTNDLARIDDFLYDVGVAVSEWLRQAGRRTTAGGSDTRTSQTERKIVEDVERLRDEVLSILEITACF